MRGLQKSKRVSWPTDGNLCQVRLFLSEDSPSQVGSGTQDHLQLKKKSGVLYNAVSVAVPDDGLPPGFEGVNPSTQLLKNKLAQIHLANWKCPPRFALNASWLLTAGEESDEVEIQNQRELRVLEAIYPRPSAIPPNPAISLDAENTICDDSNTPLVPITPIEEEDACEEASNDSAFSMGSYPPGFSHVELPSSQNALAYLPNPLKNGSSEEPVQPQLLAAASAALNAMVSGNGVQERLIDHDLLVKILNNPAMLEDFVKRQGNLSSSKDIATSSSQPLPFRPVHNPPPTHLSQMENSSVTSSTVNSKDPFYPFLVNDKPPVHYQHVPPTIPSNAQSSSLQTGAVPKDIGYYKSLIQQHGGERQQEATPPFIGHYGGSSPNPDPVKNTRPIRNSKPKFMKPCIYFNSPKGCRHGANCAYQHDPSLQQQVVSIPDMHGAKRVKMSREMRSLQPYS